MQQPQFLKQKNMARVLYALLLVFVVSIYYFGWRVAAIVFISLLFGFLAEWVMASRRGGKVSYACFVTCALYALSLPPTVPLWIAAVGIVVAIVFAKEAFGGFGKNIFNPAIVGRAFVFVCFPQELSSRFVPTFKGFPGGFAQWSNTAADALTAATPMWARRDFGYEAGWFNLFLGNIGTVFESGGHKHVLAAGSMGEVCAIVIIAGAVYLIVTKTAKWQLMASTLLGAVCLNIILRHIAGINQVPPLPFTLLSGGLMYAAVFMVTDPISAPKDKVAQWIYGFLIGCLVILFRYKAIFAGGIAFSILMGNMIAPSLDLWIKRIKGKGK
jgi:Na+-transporting NADH:ubiquinone oxidoreductase subunit B